VVVVDVNIFKMLFEFYKLEHLVPDILKLDSQFLPSEENVEDMLCKWKLFYNLTIFIFWLLILTKRQRCL